jgi:L-lactate dehydrogenase complex protein LldF
MSVSKAFQTKANDVAFDLSHRQKIKFNIGKYDAAVEKGRLRYENLSLAKERAAYVKRKVLSELPELLEKFESNISKRGVTVLWAKTDHEVMELVKAIAVQENVKQVVKSKSMTTEEVEFNDRLLEIGVETLETDLGEFIVQVAGEKPYHIVTPAMHKSKEDVDKLFHETFNTPSGSNPEELTAFVRDFLRRKFLDADLGVTGANFLIADTGSITLTENEGNALLSTSFPRIHIVLAGIEKVLPSINDLGLFWPLLAAHGTGQQMTVYNSIFSGPKKLGEIDGPEKMFVILIDNGRSELYQQNDLYQSLLCIRCGACLNGCPIYKNIGGYTYEATYSGPIGSVITPHFKDFKSYKHLSHASSLCGKCAEVCPVKIPLPDLLLENRRKSVEKGYYPIVEMIAVQGVNFVFSNSNYLDLINGKVKSRLMKLVMKNVLGDKRVLPTLPKESFRQQWSKLRGK